MTEIQAITEALEKQTGLACAEQMEADGSAYLSFGYPQLICYVFQSCNGKWVYAGAYWVNREKWTQFGRNAALAAEGVGR